jgi:hypothetical protein
MTGAPSAASGIDDGGMTARRQGWLPATPSFYAGFLQISTSMVISTSSPTTTPPVSSKGSPQQEGSVDACLPLGWSIVGQ